MRETRHVVIVDVEGEVRGCDDAAGDDDVHDHIENVDRVSSEANEDYPLGVIAWKVGGIVPSSVEDLGWVDGIAGTDGTNGTRLADIPILVGEIERVGACNIINPLIIDGAVGTYTGKHDIYCS